MSSPKEFHIDAIYPEPLSRLRRGHGGGMSPTETSNSASYRRAVKKQRNRGSAGTGRFRTQPITFQEIKEVDEDNIVELESDNLRGSVGTVASCSSFKSESDLKASFQLFYQSIKVGNDDDPIIGVDIPAPNNCGSVLPSEKLQSTGERPPLLSHNNSTPNPQQATSPIVISLNTRSRQSF